MKKFTFDVPCVGSLQVEAESEQEAYSKASTYLRSADFSVHLDEADGYLFNMEFDSESEIDLLDEEDME